MPKETLYSSLDFLVTREDRVITLEQRNRGGVAIGVAALALALGGWWLRGALNPSSVYVMLLTFFCVIMGLCAVLLLLGAMYFMFNKRGHRFDPRTGLATLNRKAFPMAEMSVPSVQTQHVGSTRIDKLTFQHNGTDVTLLSSTVQGALAPVEQALRQAFAGIAPAQPVPAASGVDAWHRFMPVFLIVFGVLWSGVGYLTIPEVIIGSRRMAGGVLLWPLGLWLIALGLLEALCLWRGQSLFTGKPRVTQVTLLVWIASYVLLCFR